MPTASACVHEVPQSIDSVCPSDCLNLVLIIISGGAYILRPPAICDGDVVDARIACTPDLLVECAFRPGAHGAAATGLVDREAAPGSSTAAVGPVVPINLETGDVIPGCPESCDENDRRGCLVRHVLNAVALHRLPRRAVGQISPRVTLAGPPPLQPVPGVVHVQTTVADVRVPRTPLGEIITGMNRSRNVARRERR